MRLINFKLASSLTSKEFNLAVSLVERHAEIRLYRGRKGAIILSREAMYTPGLREVFYVRNPRCPEGLNEKV